MDQIGFINNSVDVGVITIKETEYYEFLKTLPNATIIDGKGERRYRYSTILCKNKKNLSVAVTRCIEQGNIEAQNTAIEMLQDINPKWVLVVGIAGGVPDQEFSLGDVIISSRVYDLTLEASKPDGRREYSIKGVALHKQARKVIQDIPGMLANELSNWSHELELLRPIINLAEIPLNIFGDEEWNKKISDSLLKHFSTRRPPKVMTGAIVSSDRLIKDPEIVDAWKVFARHFCAIEMELAGVCRSLESVPVLGIRGISDIVGFSREEAWTNYACKTAAMFAFSLIQSGLLPMYKENERPIRITLEMDSRKLREFIHMMFSVESFDAFCQDYFPDVYDEFAASMTKTAKISLLLDYVRRNNYFEELLKLLRLTKPEAFNEYYEG